MSVLERVRTHICELRPDFPAAAVTPDIQFKADLDFSSVEFLHLLALLTQTLGRKFSYETLLLTNGRPRMDLTIADLCNFIEANWDSPPPAIHAM
jgi:acyl carrier protein